MDTTQLTKLKLPTVAILIDADNLSSVGIEEAFRHLCEAGATVQVRRAYGGIEKIVGMKEVLRRHAIQGFVNQGKGTTDVALVVDAMDLLHRGGLPSTVAIGSSDADFAPLAVRLREAGLLVICFAHKLISSDALAHAYDKVIYVDAKAEPIEVEVAACVEQKKNAPMPPAVASITVASGSSSAAATPNLSADKKRVDGASSKITALVTVKGVQDGSAEVSRILSELSDWLPNTVRQLNQLGGPLAKSGMKKGNKPLHELFRMYPAYFKVLPTTGAPKQIRLLKRPGRLN